MNRRRLSRETPNRSGAMKGGCIRRLLARCNDSLNWFSVFTSILMWQALSGYQKYGHEKQRFACEVKPPLTSTSAKRSLGHGFWPQTNTAFVSLTNEHPMSVDTSPRPKGKCSNKLNIFFVSSGALKFSFNWTELNAMKTCFTKGGRRGLIVCDLPR